MLDLKFIRTPSTLISIMLILLSFRSEHSSAATPNLKSGDSFFSFFWTQALNDTNKYGYYGIVKFSGQNQTDARTIDTATFRLDRCTWWQRMVANVNTKISIMVSNTKPDSVDVCAAKFDTIPWLCAISGKTDTANYQFRFFFPILPAGQIYGRYDYFSVRFNDTMDVQFQGIDDSTMIGTFIKRRIPGSATTIYAKNAIAIRTTSLNPMRIRSIQINGGYEKLVSSFLNFNLSSLRTNAAYYGITIIDTTITEQPVQISSVALAGVPKIFADSTYKLTWSMSGATAVARCSLYVSIDSAKTWLPAGMTIGSTTSYQWTAPHFERAYCNIKVLAIDNNGLKYSGISPEFAIKIASNVPNNLRPVNNYSLDGSILTPTSVRLSWSLTGAVDTSVDSIAICYDTLHHPLSMTDSASKLISVYGLKDTSDTIRNLPKGHSWYFSLFVANSDRIWSDTTRKSQLLLIAHDSSGTIVSLGIDTQRVFNDSLRLWTNPKLLLSYTDTLDPWSGPQIKPGFIQTSQGFSFRQGSIPANTSLGISMRYRSIPSPYTAYDQRIYQYNIFTGKWRLMSTNVTVDTSRRVIEALCQNPRMPFITMIDTSAPNVQRLSADRAYYSALQQIVDTLSISDNIENLQLHLLGGAGNRNISDFSAYVTPLSGQSQYLISIPPYVADQCSGLRAFLITDDGRNSIKVNLSKKILRDGNNCDDMTAGAMEWSPLFVTAHPRDSSMATIILSGSKYDKENERIILWKSNGGRGADAWLDYNPDSDSLFSLSLGKLFWIKSRKNHSIQYGQAIVPALSDTFSIRLNPQGWTDFSIPFRYDTYLGDILKATRKVIGTETDSVRLYHWKKSGTSFITDQVFLSGIDSLCDSTRILPGGEPYSAYNPLSSALTLRIPAEGTSFLSANSFRKTINNKSQNISSWSVKIGVTARDTLHLAPIYFASTPASGIPRWHPISPSFSPISVGIKNQHDNKVYGNAAGGDLSNGGCLFELNCDNKGYEVTPLSLHIEQCSGLPKDVTASLLSENGTGGAIHDALQFPLGAQHTNTCYLLIGDNNYVKKISKLLLSKLSLRIVRYSGKIHLLFTLPYGTRSIEFRMYDLKGRKVWNLKQNGTNFSANHALLIEKPLSTGFYFIELRANVAKERSPRIIRKKVITIW